MTHNRGYKRTDRVAGTIQRQLSLLIQREVKDPELPKFLTISAVKVSNDLSHAKIYFTVYDADVGTTTRILNRASSFLRSALAKHLTTRIVPELHFVYDASVEYGRKLTQLIDDVNDIEPTTDDES